MKKILTHCDNPKCKSETDDLWAYKTERMQTKIHLCWACYCAIEKQVLKVINASNIIP